MTSLPQEPPPGESPRLSWFDTRAADAGEVHAEVTHAKEELGRELRTSAAALRAECFQRIEELEARVAALEGGRVASPNGETGSKATRTLSEILSGEPKIEGQYELAMSMWDAGLLLFIRRNRVSDQLNLVFGILLNLTLQILFSVVISFNMLDNEFSTNTINEMMTWRVGVGHSMDSPDIDTGDSVVRKLCNLDLWSYEQAEYEDIYNYLYRRIPGPTLSVLAITLWVLSTMSELRQCTSQFGSIAALPRIGLFEDGVKESAPGEFEIVGISNAARYLAFIVLFVPRVVVALCLMVVGCKYLAQTITLSDIVLNTVALAFVLEVDEHIAKFLLTERVQFIVQRLQPMKSGNSDSRAARVRDVIRPISAVGVVVFAYLYWLRPFVANVETAATTLCGGHLDFFYSGGSRLDPNLVIVPKYGTLFDDYDIFCPAEESAAYYNTYYPGYNFTGSLAEAAIEAENMARLHGFSSANTQEKVLQYAYQAHDCAAGEMRGPPKARSNQDGLFKRIFGSFDDLDWDLREGDCARPEQRFSEVVPEGVQPGREHVVEDCPRFNISLDEDACMAPMMPDICQWSFESIACENTTPGNLYFLACGADLWMACRTWEMEFNRSHPTRNCEITRQCRREQPNCMRMLVSFDIIVDHWTNLTGSESILGDAAKDALDVSIHVWHRWSELSLDQVDLLGAGTGAPPCVGANMGATIGCLRVSFLLEEVGEDLTPAVLRRANASIAAIMSGNLSSTGREALVLGVVFNESFPVWALSEGEG